jgi:hypothetical protein
MKPKPTETERAKRAADLPAAKAAVTENIEWIARNNSSPLQQQLYLVAIKAVKGAR